MNAYWTRNKTNDKGTYLVKKDKTGGKEYTIYIESKNLNDST